MLCAAVGWLVRVSLLVALAAAIGLLVPGSLRGSIDAGAERLRPAPVDPQESALRRLRRAADGPTSVAFENGFPRVVLTSVPTEGDTLIKQATRFIREYKELYGLFMGNPFAVASPEWNRLGLADTDQRYRDFLRLMEAYQGKPTSTPDLSLSVQTVDPALGAVAFRQTYKGVPVLGGELLVFVRDGRVTATVGTLISDLTLDVAPRLTDGDAEEAARRALGMRGAHALARTDLVVFDDSLLSTRAFTRPSPHLAWRVALAAGERPVVYVDADDGRLLFSSVQVNAHTDDYDLDLEDANGADAMSTSCYWDTTANDALGDEDGLNADGLADPEAVVLRNLPEQAYGFYHDVFGLHSYDDDDGQFELYVHANVGSAGARWVAGTTDCDLIEFATGQVAYDVLVHELAHATLDRTSLFGGPLYVSEPGAVDESHSDVMGAFADGNWLVAEGAVGGPARDMSNPSVDRMSQFAQVANNNDNGGVHTNSGIGNKAAFLLADGGVHPATGWSVSGIGKAATGWLRHQASLWLMPTWGFSELRALELMFAETSYDAFVMCQVRRAWAAVEVGKGDLDCDGVEENADFDADDDGVFDWADNCPSSPNGKQENLDGDNLGDVCDKDADGDGTEEWGTGFPYDNCPGIANDQKDENFNGIGAACDPTEDGDLDDDGIADASDNCKLDANTSQADVDNDGAGDACDPDTDGDGWSNDDDNAPFEYNPDQKDSDGDGIGDVSDACPETADESLGWTKFDPNLGIDPHPIQPDSDGDGTPDACDRDVLVAARVTGSDNVISPDGKARLVDVEGSANRYLKVPLALATARAPTWYGLDERRTLVLSGVDDRVKTWIGDDEGRSVARAKPKRGEERALRFRPLAGRRYYLFLFFNGAYEQGRRESFTATMRSETVVRTPPPPPPRQR